MQTWSKPAPQHQKLTNQSEVLKARSLHNRFFLVFFSYSFIHSQEHISPVIGGFFQLENIKIPVCIIHHSCNDFWWRLLKMRDWSPHTALWRFLRTWQNKLGRTCLNINLHSDPLRRRPLDEGVLVTMLWPYLMSSLIHPWKKIRVNWNMILCTATEKKKNRISQRSIYGPN